MSLHLSQRVNDLTDVDDAFSRSSSGIAYSTKDPFSHLALKLCSGAVLVI